MLFQPSNQLNIIPEDEFLQRIPEIESQLEPYANLGDLHSFDGTRLAYAYYQVPNPKANIIIIHGFTEFYKKYSEMIWYFLNMSYNVFIFDQRGHGLSDHMVEDPELSHVDHFQDYVQDLTCFIDQIVIPNSMNAPLHLYSYSMGGTVALLYMKTQHGKDHIKKMILASPMVAPYALNLPIPIVKRKTRLETKKNGAKGVFPYSGKFRPDVEFQNTSDGSYGRFRHNLDLRISDRRYQTSSASNRWMSESVLYIKEIMNKDTCKQMDLPILMFSGKEDKVVRRKYHKPLSQKLAHCTLVEFPGVKHSIFTAKNEVLSVFYELIFQFLKQDK